MNTHYTLQSFFLLITLLFVYTSEVTALYYSRPTSQTEKPRVIVTTDGEADDRASMVRFLLSANEFDVEGIINSSSQFHWEGGKGWNAFHPVEWIREYIEYYKKVYPNLLLHDKNYPSPEYLLSKWKVGNIKGDGEYRERTEGAQFIAKVLSTKWKPFGVVGQQENWSGKSIPSITSAADCRKTKKPYLLWCNGKPCRCSPKTLLTRPLRWSSWD